MSWLKKAKEKAESNAWTQITTYLADKREKMAQEVKLHLELSSEANVVIEVDHTLD